MTHNFIYENHNKNIISKYKIYLVSRIYETILEQFFRIKTQYTRLINFSSYRIPSAEYIFRNERIIDLKVLYNMCDKIRKRKRNVLDNSSQFLTARVHVTPALIIFSSASK